MAQNVRFISVKLKSSFVALEQKDPLALYWISETSELFKGDQLFGTGAIASEQAAGLLSPEDYTALKALIASGGGISNLSPVNGSIVIGKNDNGATIGVGLSAVEGNMLSIKEDGLYAEAVAVPEYAIEKQATATEGFSATYKLKKTVNGVDSYVGDEINLPKDLVLQSATLETVTEVDVPYAGAVVGDPYIKMTFNDANASALYIPVKGLVDTYTAGDGISIENGVVSVKIAAESHGLVAVDGSMAILLATKDNDGAMSKEDKKALDAIPSVYVARKYDISDTPKGTLVNYCEDEIRIMVPADAEFKKQAVGTGGDANTYYMTFKTFAPHGAVGYKEHLGNQSDSEILTDLKTDEHGRRYQPTWLGLAKYDEATDAWSYYGKSSSEDRYIGWDYRIDWCDENGIVVASDSVRINLSNETCHNNIRPYYMANYATATEIDELHETINKIQQDSSWEEW